MASFSRSMSRRSSVATIPSREGPHRLDLLIQEQRTSLVNAQEGLKKSMAILERAQSKEEKESAKMQVQSLMTRAEELAFLAKVVQAIRTELGHVQAEAEACKKNHQNPHSFYLRQQWLESRLETLLLAKKRGRPGGRGQRTQAAPQRNIPQRTFARKSLDTISSQPQSTQDSFDALSDFTRQTSPSTREASLPPIIASKTGGSVVSDDRKLTTHHASARVETSSSSKLGSTEESSHESWHSDSEANWTLPGGSIRHYRDLGQSQTLSEIPDETRGQESSGMVRGEGTYPRKFSVSFSEPPSSAMKIHSMDRMLPASIKEASTASLHNEDSESTMHLTQSSPDATDVLKHGAVPMGTHSSTSVPTGAEVAKTYGFELPRSLEVFGDCSWNLLPLAVRTNFVKPLNESSPTLYDERFRDMSAVRGALDNFCVEADILKQLIVDASEATIKSGALVSASKKSALKSYKSLSAHDSSAGPVSSKPIGSGPRTNTLPSIAPIPNTYPRCSRRLYGMNKLEDYPRNSTSWHKSTMPTKRSALARSSTHERIMSSYVDRCLEKYQLANIRAKKGGGQKAARKSSRPETKSEDLFERDKYRQKRIDYVCKQLDSSNAEIRKDNAQALGQLTDIGDHAKDCLLSVLAKDNDISVRYRAMCSLLQQEIITKHTIAYCSAFLSKGSTAIQEEILQLLCQDNIMEHLLEEIKDFETKEACPDFHHTLEGMLADGEGKVPILTAKILSHAQLSRDVCVERLKGLLESPVEEIQNTALDCLSVQWQCTEEQVLDAGLKQMTSLSHWKFRQRAVECLGRVSVELERVKGSQFIYKSLVTRLRNEPILAVRIAIGKLLKSLKLSSEAEELFLSELTKSDEVTRNNAILALTAFEIKEKATVLALLELMMLDPSNYVRAQVVRAFGGMTHYDEDVITSLIKRSREHGILARVSTEALNDIYKHLEESA